MCDLAAGLGQSGWGLSERRGCTQERKQEGPAHRGCRVSLHEGKEKGHPDPIREEAAALGLVPAEAIHSLKPELLSR